MYVTKPYEFIGFGAMDVWPVGGWVPEGSLAGVFWVGFWGLGGPWGL